MKNNLKLTIALIGSLFAGNAFGLVVGRTNVVNETGADLWISFNKVTYSCLGGFAGITKLPDEKYCSFDLIEKGGNRSPGSSATGSKAVIYAYTCKNGVVTRVAKNYEVKTDKITVSLNSSGDIEVEETGESYTVELKSNKGKK